MYRTDDRPAAIRQIQIYLYEIHKRERLDIPRVPIDGIYGNETRAAVIKFQEIKGLPTTGTVDYETFSAIYEEYNEAIAFQNSEYTPMGNRFPIKVGDSGADIEIIHLLFRELSEYYIDLPLIRKSSYFSEESAEFSRMLSQIFGLESDGSVTAELYHRMLFELSRKKRL